MARPSLRPDEPSASINLRLPASKFDYLCKVASFVAYEKGEHVSLPEIVRRFIPEDVNEVLYGAMDDRPPLDARHIDALCDDFNARQKDLESARHRAVQVAREASALAHETIRRYEAVKITNAAQAFEIEVLRRMVHQPDVPVLVSEMPGLLAAALRKMETE